MTFIKRNITAILFYSVIIILACIFNVTNIRSEAGMVNNTTLPDEPVIASTDSLYQ